MAGRPGSSGSDEPNLNGPGLKALSDGNVQKVVQAIQYDLNTLEVAIRSLIIVR